MVYRLETMDITYLGHSSFRIKSREKTIVTDPYDDRVGKFPKGIEADILTISHEHSDHNQADKVAGVSFQVRGPGEYETGGVSIIGVPACHDDKNGDERGQSTIYVIEADGLRIVHMGDLGHKLTQEQLDEIGAIDIMMVPVGGEYTIDAKTATEVVRQVDPWVVIPMHYRTDETKLSKEISGVEDFLKEMGKPGLEPAPKYSVTAERLPEELQVVVLDKKS